MRKTPVPPGEAADTPPGPVSADQSDTLAAASPAPAPKPRWLTTPTGTATTVAALVLALAVSVVLAVGLGSAVVPPRETLRYLWAALTGGLIQADELMRYQVIWQIRTPRVLLAAVVGAGLGAVGVAIQAMVRNALADPYILGVSSGASVGAVLVGVLGAFSALGIYAVSAGAFAGALVATLLVYAVSRSRAGTTPLRLVLTGVALSFGFQAIMSVIVYLAPSNEATSTVLFWTMGSFGAAVWGSLPVVAAAVLLGVLLLRALARPLDVLALGDETAASLGVNADRLRRRMFVLTAVMTGAMVAVSGAIGFVGLVVPHIVRILVGADHRRVLTVAPLAGAVLMVWVDLVSRVAVAPRELPLGVITALVGVPVFILLMRRRGYLFGGR
ncbi:sugar ABC transporter substrate-binding protein [Nocardiopsis terrae]|uniref:Iron complex transport system permease protein n=1 Tax=Nocardiopsis terrae TaxID=372655 RepID=A0ABR9HGF5_9ACTN|nr:iron ABC transporter permease [Nocardiopsis terrae]MBE1458084.1 iron complex transport system permease protein [Nocardiopsis terrae]GHC82278.1 sugar ABC transporter substrate-binding protein [Nocardiopsis terrae]